MFFTRYNIQEYQVFNFSKIQARDVFHASGITKKHVKLIAHKIWHFLILQKFLKEKYTKEVVLEMDIIPTLSVE